MKKRLLVGVSIVFVLGLLWSGSAQGAEGFFILQGDLHAHSEFSHDSEVPIGQVVEESGIAGYDFISITDHNTTRHMTENYSTDRVLVIAGYEHTTPAAHINIFGLRTIPRKSALYTLEEMEEYLEPLRAKGGLFQLNHPNDKLYYSRFGYELDTHFIEILNGVWREDDHQTLKDWHQLLVEGRRVVATSGTDVHKNHTIRGAFNNVYVTERSEAAILEALLEGRNFVTISPEGPVIDMTCDGVIMGGTVDYRDGQTMTMDITNIAPGTIMKIYSNRGLHLQDVHPGGWYQITVDTRFSKFFRVELWASEKAIVAFSNPIFIKH